ncbi:MAG: NADP-dependent oxidoreductase [Nostoc sp.]|uniref:NADP-dependent oxidoreductase n=1 Tax=Nostoc sp. TaxID=1180 RepID=UPI002FF51C16
MATMKAIRIHAYGGAENLKYDEVSRPEPQAGQVLIQVYAAGVNPIDWKIREGFFQQLNDYSLPVIAGADVAGVVASVGDGVTTLQPGQAVYGTADMALSGAYAEYAVGYADAIAPKPKTLDYIHAASVPIVAITAWQALFDGANLQPEQSVLIHGGAGGVGRYAIQLAKWKRARVIATASAANLDDLRNLGVDQAIDYASQPFEQQVKDVDVVLDLVGGETQARSWQIIRPGGVLVSTLGVPESGIPQGIKAVPVFANLRANSQLQQIAQLIDDGQIKASIEQVFELAEAAKAQEVSQHGHPRGKLVLQVVHPA